jgi:hypothetical protein
MSTTGENGRASATASEADLRRLLGERYEALRAAAEAWSRRSIRPAFR